MRAGQGDADCPVALTGGRRPLLADSENDEQPMRCGPAKALAAVDAHDAREDEREHSSAGGEEGSDEELAEVLGSEYGVEEGRGFLRRSGQQREQPGRGPEQQGESQVIEVLEAAK